MDRYTLVVPDKCACFDEALASLFTKLKTLGNEISYAKFFCSDAQNQLQAFNAALKASKLVFKSYTLVEQPPLDGSRICALVRITDDKENFLLHSIRLEEAEAYGLDSYAQTRLLFQKYMDIIKPLGLSLATHCARTWIYVRDIDSNYAGVVKARNDVFAEEGLSFDTHYIASTGIGGASGTRSAVVAMDFLTYPELKEEDKLYLKALSHLSPTHDYGVAFERGVRLNLPGKERFLISGTASINSKGYILFDGDVLAQTERLLENIDALLKEGGASIEDVPYFIVYLRDISDYSTISKYMDKRFPGVPYVIVAARVCRPGWLIEMECSAVKA